MLKVHALDVPRYRGHTIAYTLSGYGYKAIWKSSLEDKWVEGHIIVDTVSAIEKLAQECIDFNYKLHVRELELGRKLTPDEIQEEIEKDKETQIMAKVRKTDDGFVVKCPGCGIHVYDARWNFNGDFNRPSFTPSMSIKVGPMPNDHPKAGQIQICHSYVLDGKIQFLSDCTHEYKDKTVDLPELDK